MLGVRWVVGGALVGTGALTALLTAFGWRARDEIGADWFTALMAADTLWVFRDVAILFTDQRGPLLALEWIGSIVATLVPVLWFSFVLAYTGRERVLDRRGFALVWAVPAVVVASILTSPLHDLYYAGHEFTTAGDRTLIASTPGPLAWANLAYFAVLSVAGLWLIGRMLWDHDRFYSGQAVWLLTGTAAPMALLAATLLVDVSDSLPVIPFGFTALGLAYGHGLFNHRLLDLSPASRRIGVPEAFDDFGEGAVIVDADRDVVALNDRACRLLDREKADVLGEPLGSVSPTLAELTPETDGTDVSVDGRVFQVTVSRVRDARDRPVGETFLVRDVTDDRRRKQRLEVLSRVFRHNIRNTMNAVVGPMDVLVHRLDGEDRELAETARGASEKVVALSESVRTVEEMMTDPLTPRRLAVADVVDAVVASVREETDFAVETSVPPELTVVTDSFVLTVVLEHAVENAVVHADAETPTVEISAEGSEGGCLVHVTDEGPGIPPSELAVLRAGVETQLDHASGIGLWAIHWGVTRLDGAVRFRPRESGTRVTVWIPSMDVDDDPRGSPDEGGADEADVTESGGPPVEGAGPDDGPRDRFEAATDDPPDAPGDAWFGAREPPFEGDE